MANESANFHACPECFRCHKPWCPPRRAAPTLVEHFGMPEPPPRTEEQLLGDSVTNMNEAQEAIDRALSNLGKCEKTNAIRTKLNGIRSRLGDIRALLNKKLD